MSSAARVLAAVCSALIFAVVVACGSQPATSPGAPSPTSPAAPAAAAPSRLLDPAAFAAAVADPRTTTINVHVPYAGDIPGTTLSIPFDRIGAETGRLPADRTAPLALYCRTGPMSADAARTLADAGYTNIVELAGGMGAWTQSGRPLIGRPAGDG